MKSVLLIGLVSAQPLLGGVIFFEGFNQAVLPSGWSLSNATPISFVTSSANPAADPYEGTHFVRFNSFNAPSGTRAALQSPAISTLAREEITVAFAWHRDVFFPTRHDRVIVSWSLDGAAWEGTNTYLRYGAAPGWSEQTLALPPAAANQTSVYLRFEFVSGYGNNCYLDAVRVSGKYPGEPDPPAHVSATALSSSAIILAWQTNAAGDAVMVASNSVAGFGAPSNGWWYAAGDVLPGGGQVLYSGTGMVVVLTGLTPASPYFFRAWSVSSATNYSDGVSAHAMTDFELPIEQGFNSAALPAGWTVSNGLYLTYVTVGFNPEAVAYEGSHFVRFNSYSAPSGTYATLTSPRFATQGGLAAVFVDFAWHQDPGRRFNQDRMTVQWSSNGSVWVNTRTLYRVGSPAGWTQQRVVLPPAALGHAHLQVRFTFRSERGYNCYLDGVRILGALPNVHLDPVRQATSAAPDTHVAHALRLLNLTGADRDVTLSYHSSWPASGPATSGVLTNWGATNIQVYVHVPVTAIDGQTATTTVEAVTSDGVFTNSAVLITTCRWVVQPICEWFHLSLGEWTNYFAGGVNNGWQYSPLYGAAFHEQESGGTNWLVSPGFSLGWAERASLLFYFGTWNSLTHSQGVYLVTGDRNPMLGTATQVATIDHQAGYWFENVVDLTPFITNTTVYLAFAYVSPNPQQLLTAVCIDASKTGINHAHLRGPHHHPAMVSYDATLAITGALYISGETGTNGPAALVSGHVGFGPATIPPDAGTWTWYPATYLGADGAFDLYTATPQVTIAGPLRYCYRFRRGDGPWVYADLDGSDNGIDTNQLGSVLVTMLPPQGELLRQQTISLNFELGAGSDYDASAVPPRYMEAADEVTFPYDTVLKSVRMGGLYWNAGRQNIEQGFWLRLYANVVSNPGALLYQQFVPGYACEQWMGRDAFGTHCYVYHFDLATPWFVPAGTTCWIAVQHVVSNATRWSVLDSPDFVRGYAACARDSLGSPWAPFPFGRYDLGLEVYGAVSNAGALVGSVRDARSAAPIKRAQIVISNAHLAHVVTTDTNGVYASYMADGAYAILARKAHYAPAALHNVAISAGSITTADFVLDGSHVVVFPTNLTRVMPFNTQTHNPLVISNTGPLPVQFSLHVRHLGVATAQLARVTRVAIPPSNGDFPRGSRPVSLGPAPSAGALPREHEPAQRTLSSSPVTAYGFNVNPAIPNALVRLSTHAPGSLTTIGPAETGPGSFVCGAAFLNGDFSQLYCLVYGGNRLVTVNTTNATVTHIADCVPPPGESWTGLAAAPDGTLYASAHGDVSKLYTVNPDTGALTLVGPITDAGLIIGIAINAAGDMYGVDILSNTLVRINRMTAVGSHVGLLGFDANYAQDLAFDLQHDVLYLAAYNDATSRGELRVADIATGNSVLIGTLGSSSTQVDGFETMTVPPDWWARAATNAGTIAAGAAQTVPLTFDASVVSNAGDYFAAVSFAGTFVNSVSPVPLTMSVVFDPLIAAPTYVAFGDVLVGEMTNLPLWISNVGAGVLSGSIAGVIAPFSLLGDATYAVPAGATSVHTVAFAPLAETGYTNVITLSGGGGATVVLMGTGVPEPAGLLGALVLAAALLRAAPRARPRRSPRAGACQGFST